MSVHTIILALAIIGIGVSFYLNGERKKNRPPLCIIGDTCEKVWASPLSNTLGVSNEVYGIVFYATMIIIAGSLFLGDINPSLIFGEHLLLWAGSIMSFYFVYIQWRVIKAWCFWCTLSAVLTCSMLFLLFVP